MTSSLYNRLLSRIPREIFRFSVLRNLPWLVLFVSLLVSYQLWNYAQNETEQALRTEFNDDVEEAGSRVYKQMLAYEAVLRGTQGLFAASVSVERNEFRDYVHALNLNKNYPGIQGLGFNLLLPQQAKQKHIAAIRKQGFPNYAIMPEGQREAYSTVLYVEPFTGQNLRAFGHDNFADPVTRTVMERVRDTGLSLISPNTKLMLEADSSVLALASDNQVQAGFSMWLPLYKNDLPHLTLAERRANLVGWVAASFRIEELMASIFSSNEANLHMEIYDGNVISDQTLMYKLDKLLHSSMAAYPYFRSVKKLDIAGHRWTMVLTSLPDFDKRLYDKRSRLIAYAGLSLSLLLTLLTGILVYGRNRALQAVKAVHRELSERKRAADGMRLAEKVFDSVDVAVLVTNKSTHIIKVNPAFTAITGYSPEEAIGKTPRILASGAHSRGFYEEMWSTLKTTGSWQGEIFNRRKNGKFFTEWLSINQVHDNDGMVTNYVAMFSDISARKAAEERMHKLAHYDPLTGLPNRTLFADRLQQAISAAKREKIRMALMFIDLDKFKPVNDTHGHHIGDLVLKEVAKRILECLRESDSAARLGGDEFVVLLPIIEEVADAVAVAEKIRYALNQVFMLAGHRLNISSSIGVAVYPEHGTDEKILLKNADTAMYYAKEAGRNRVMLYEARMVRAD